MNTSKAIAQKFSQSSQPEEEIEGMTELRNGFKMESEIYSKLYPHQRKGKIYALKFNRCFISKIRCPVVMG